MLSRCVCLIAIVSLLISGSAWQGAGLQPRDTTQGAVSQDESSSGMQIAAENSYYRVFRVRMTPRQTMDLRRPGRDAVVVSWKEGLVLLLPDSRLTVALNPGDARFLPLGARVQAVNPIEAAQSFLLVEFKRHWDPPVRMCSGAPNCVRPLKAGGLIIGESESLFTNGFLTSYRHRLDRGGTLASSYYSPKGKHHLLLIALTDLQADFDGVSESLHAGESYTSDASSIEVNAADGPARWIVMRVQTPD